MVLHTGGTIAIAQAATFLCIVLIQYMNILSRRNTGSVFGRHLLSSPPLWSSLIFSFVVLTVIIGFPAIGGWFGFEPLRLQDWTWPVLAALVLLASLEVKKLLARRRAARSQKVI